MSTACLSISEPTFILNHYFHLVFFLFCFVLFCFVLFCFVLFCFLFSLVEFFRPIFWRMIEVNDLKKTLR